MNSYYTCTFFDHENNEIIGFCTNYACSQNPQFCLKCLQDRHKNHVQDCNDFRQFQDLLRCNLKNNQKALDELNQIYNQIKQEYEFHNKVLAGEISKLQQLIEIFNQKQYYEIKQFLGSGLSLIQNNNQHVLAFSQKIEKTFKGIQKPTFNESVIQRPQQQLIIDKEKAEQDLKQGWKLWDQQSFQEALFFFNESLKNNPHQDQVYIWKARTLNKLGQFIEAAQTCDIAIQINPQNDCAYSTKASSLYSQGKIEEALICCDKAIKMNPKNEMVYTTKGLALGNLGRTQEELMCYEKAIEINKYNETPYINKSRALNRLGQFKEAIICCNEVLKINPQLHQALSIKGIALLELKQYKEAFKSLDKAYSISKNLDYLVIKADALFEQGQKELSKQCFNEALKKGYHDKQYIQKRLNQLC
ncbi:unnamed protein product [Paramecium sonneborni]|uniref:Tetratricopeptide repeat protein n=1 Tax=Paramecium sonneborni TaxID=65129 RepID=A0A8S1PFI9_9CILI|nr:unnamed protein product [Paramecium sonneborni]